MLVVRGVIINVGTPASVFWAWALIHIFGSHINSAPLILSSASFQTSMCVSRVSVATIYWQLFRTMINMIKLIREIPSLRSLWAGVPSICTLFSHIHIHSFHLKTFVFVFLQGITIWVLTITSMRSLVVKILHPIPFAANDDTFAWSTKNMAGSSKTFRSFIKRSWRPCSITEMFSFLICFGKMTRMSCEKNCLVALRRVGTKTGRMQQGRMQCSSWRLGVVLCLEDHPS